MPIMLVKPFLPHHNEVCKIDGPIPDWIGIHQGKEKVAYFVSNPGENITPGKKTNSKWRYYPIPPEAQYVVFDVTWDEHPKVIGVKLISIAEFRDAQNQSIPIPRGSSISRTR